jgi:ketosteroid isomerase-like protein
MLQSHVQDTVVETVRLMYAAAARDDLDGFRAVSAPGFCAFETGKRMTGDELMGRVLAAHAAGKVYAWHVTEPRVRVDGTTAWITYVNRGSIEDASGKQEVSWVESAVHRKHGDSWLIHFFHATRAPSG